MTYRRRHRWLRRLALGLAFATFVAPAAARPDENGGGSNVVTAGGWTGPVDPETGIPLSAGIPQGDEQFTGDQAPQVIPYLSHGILTEADAAAAAAEAIHDPYLTDVFVRPGESLGGPDGDEIAVRNALDRQAVAKAEAVHDPYLTDLFVRPGESLGGPDGTAAQSASVLGEAVETRQAPEPFVQGVTDFPKPTAVEAPPVISYLSHGMTAGGETAVRPDDRADRFAHSDVAAAPELSSGLSVDWDDRAALAIGVGVLTLGLGLGLGFAKRPRLAGM